ncbi:MAG: hypothetical protein ACLQPD_35215 [Desulfomonilaceae bacterium]
MNSVRLVSLSAEVSPLTIVATDSEADLGLSDRTMSPVLERYIVEVMDHIGLGTEIATPLQSCNQMTIAAAMVIAAVTKWDSVSRDYGNNSSKS